MITNNTDLDNRVFLDTSLTYNKTFEEEMEEQRKIEMAIYHLEKLGVKVKTEYGYYRNIYNVLKDLGECLDKTHDRDSLLLAACRKYLGEE